MKQVIYAMQFKGKAAPGASQNVMKATTSASGNTLTTVVGPDGVQGKLEPTAGGKAQFESEVTLTGATSFLEKGPSGWRRQQHFLHFSTVERGYLGDSADPKLKSGAVMWRVDGGEGQFAGASGYITSNFTLSDAGEVTDNQFGVIFTK